MKQSIVFAACMVAFSAYASCGQRGIPNEVCPDPTDPGVPVSATRNTEARAASVAAQQQRQRQQQTAAAAQRQGITGSGNGTGVASAQASGNGFNGAINISGAAAGSGDSYDNRTLVLPNVPSLPPVIIPAANQVVIDSGCGPLMTKIQKPIDVHYHDITDHEVKQQGWTDEVGRAADYGGDMFERGVDGKWYGSRVIIIATVISTGSMRQLVLGGGSGDKWGQGGAGAGGSNQQQSQKVTVFPCQLQAVALPPAQIPPARLIKAAYRPRPAPAPRPCMETVEKRICIRR